MRTIIRKITTTTMVVALLGTTACGGNQHLNTSAAPNNNTKDVVLDVQMQFDEDAHALPSRPMTMTESIMSTQVRQHCLQLVNERIKGAPKSMIKKTVVAGILQGIGSLLGAAFAHFTGVNPAQYGKVGLGSGAGGGAFAGYMSIEQARSVANSFCQIRQIDGLRINGDRRLQQIIAIPVVGLEGSPLPVDPNARTLTKRQKCVAKAKTPEDAAKCATEVEAVDADYAPPLPATF
ncbi:MAG: hypothetical protein JWN49_702 [Parcubacteria group bacterium]|nr:hypothetical protein [Parcubacteria group bacterium]